MLFKKAVLIKIAESHFDQQYWDKIDELVETKVLLDRDNPNLLDELKDADILMLGFQVSIEKVSGSPYNQHTV